MTDLPERVNLLTAAINLTSGDRNIEYGEPYDNFSNIAALWNSYLINKYRGQEIDEKRFKLLPEDVAMLNLLQKIARTFIGAPKADTYIDAAAYAAIAGECAKIENEE